MRDLPTSTKILIISMVILTFGLGIFVISNSTPVRDAISIKDLKEMRIENPEQVLKKYKSFKSNDEANAYIKEVVDKSGNTLTKDEKALFGKNLLLEYTNVNDKDYDETTLYIKYNKMEDYKDLDILKQYMSNDKAYPVKIIYSTNKSSLDYGRFIFGDLKLKNDENYEVEDYNEIIIPKAFLVIDGEIVDEFSDYKDLKLQQ